MSGGSWDYLCYKMEDAAKNLLTEKCIYRRSFGDWMRLAAKAMHDIEWVDSCDYGEGDELEAIKKIVNPKDCLNICMSDIEIMIKELSQIVNNINGKRTL